MTNEELHAIFIYEDTGMLRRIGGRKLYPWHSIGSGRYLAFSNGPKTYYLHRLVWQYHHRSVPEFIDHIDNDQSNNRIENLRECTNGQNQFNSRRKVNNRSGIKGVVFYPPCTGKPWHAKINVNGRRISLGYHATREDAAAAYAAGAEKYAGVFARADADLFRTP